MLIKFCTDDEGTVCKKEDFELHCGKVGIILRHNVKKKTTTVSYTKKSGSVSTVSIFLLRLC